MEWLYERGVEIFSVVIFMVHDGLDFAILGGMECWVLVTLNIAYLSCQK
jgi:hypothetical protein